MVKLRPFLVTLVSLLVVSTGSAALKWSDGDHANNDHWSNPLNWLNGTAPGWTPTAADDVLVIEYAQAPASPVVATAGQLARNVNIGYWSFSGTLDIASTGVLTSDNMIVGNGSGPANSGVLNINGGTLNSRIMNVGTNGTDTTGTANLYGGSINLDLQIVVGNNGHTGRLNIYDGVADVGKLYISVNGGHGVVDIHDGTVIVTNAAAGVVQYNAILDMITDGRIIGFDGVGQVNAVFDGTSVTTITAVVPEPATMMLLGSGLGILLRRRR